MREYTHGSLFDGYGGLRRGIEQAGFRTLWAKDLIYGNDVSKDDPRECERVQLLSGGPVCRKTSRAARWQKQKTNESLYPHMLRFVAHLRPDVALIEQPASVDRALILSWVTDLECLGYGVAARIIDSQHWVPQRRARWFIVGRMGGAGLDLWNHLYPDSLGVEGANIQGSPRQRFDGNCPDCVRGGIFARVSARRTALMGAGNAVTQPVAEWLAWRIRAVLDTEAEAEGGGRG